MGRLMNSLSDLTAEALLSFRQAVSRPQDAAQLNSLNKAITQATGLVWYDLQAPAKNMVPVITPLRNRIARVGGGGGTATNWKAVTGINTSNLRGFVPEGKRNGAVATTVTPKSASYKTLGLEDTVTFEAEMAAQNFEDIRATTAQRLLWALMIEEELAILGGNNSVALGTPATPVGVRGASGGSIPASGGTYKARVVALTLFGYLASSLANGVVHHAGAAVVMVMSGGWFSAHEMINPQVFSVLLDRGYTVFTVVHGSGARKLAVFEDPNCGYCKHFEAELQNVNNVTVYVFLIPILGEDSVAKARDIWCSKDRADAWEGWMIKHQAPATGKCDTVAIDRNLAFAQRYRINGTPALFFADGTRVPGAIPAAKIEAMLGKAN